ncbi:MAG: DUF4139 domain-containing protein [Campylobacterales bacterium]|nr:DUF4139 domain-containing protein [Campylobacterales bacterium]
MLERLVGVFLGFACALQAAYLEVYQDQSRYRYRPESTYIGLAEGVRAMDANGALMLHREAACEEAQGACKELLRLEALRRRDVHLEEEYSALETLLSVQRPQGAIEPKTLMEQAAFIAQHKAQIATERAALSLQIQETQARLQQRTTSEQGLFFDVLPGAEVELIIDKGVGFESVYLLDLDAKVLFHDVMLTNRSGIDLIVDEVRLYDRRADTLRPPIAFAPQVIRNGAPEKLKRTAVMAMEAAPAPAAPQMTQERLRQYRLGKTVLESDGAAQRFEIEQTPLAPTQSLRWDAYGDKAVYETVTLELPKPLESETIKVRQKGRLIEHARMLREASTLRINTAVAYEIEAERKRLVDFSEQKGLFGGDLQKEEGVELHLHNRDTKSRSVTVCERIPVSSDERIVVALRAPSIEGKALEYRFDARTGKLEFEVTLAPDERTKVLIGYTIRYPKEMSIYY